MNGLDYFVMSQTCRQRPEKAVGCVDAPSDGCPENLYLTIAGDDNARHFRCGVGVSQAATDRTAVPYLVMRYVIDSCGNERIGGRQAGMFFDVSPAHHGAD